jgi:hypothetical protein
MFRPDLDIFMGSHYRRCVRGFIFFYHHRKLPDGVNMTYRDSYVEGKKVVSKQSNGENDS